MQLPRMRYAVFISAFLAYALLAPDSFINADATVYAEQIREANFSERTTHLGYYLLAHLVNYLPLKLDYALNLLNCAFGAGVVALVGLIAEAVVKSRHAAYIASAIAFANQGLAYNALHAEVYAGQTFFLLLSVYLWLRRMSLTAGGSAAVAFLFSASTAYAAPFFILMRPRLRPLFQFAGCGAILVAGALLPVWHNYLFGARGLMSAAGAPVDLGLAVLKTGQDGFFGFFATLPFLIAGLVACRRWRFAWAVAAMGAVTFLFGEKFMDVPVQFPTWMLACVIAAVGVRTIATRTIGLSLAVIIPILAVYPFVPARIADHLPSLSKLGLYCLAVWAVARFRGRALPFALCINLIVIGHGAIKARTDLATFAATAKSLKPANWNEMVRRNWIVCGTAYCTSQAPRERR